MSDQKRPKPPKPGIKLYENLFNGLSFGVILNRISEGIYAAIENSNRLIEDVELLLKSKRFASAGFLLATADEEMAKVYILLDMCRLDFTKHENTLKHLCRAFYEHVAKFAYNEIVRFSLGFRDMEHVKEMWLAEITRWWPSGYESGEPDFPHDTYFLRELPLYVDFIEFDQKWHLPDRHTLKYRFDREFGEDSFSDSKKALNKLNESRESGFFSPECLAILNGNFRKHFLSEKTENITMAGIYKKVKDQLSDHFKEDFESSALNHWPLYPFVDIIR